MDTGLATILAAAITALVVAATFVVGEVIRLARDRAERRSDAVGQLLAALDEVPDFVLTRAISWFPFMWMRDSVRSVKVYTNIALAATSLYGSLPTRDHRVADWVCWKLHTLPSGERLLVLAAEVRGVMTAYMIDRKRVRAFVHRPNPEFEAWRERGGVVPL